MNVLKNDEQLVSSILKLDVHTSTMTQPEVKTIYGKIRGSVEKNCEGIDFYAFKGIPYAKPPIGKLRFKVCQIFFR